MKPLYEITDEIAALLEQTDEDGCLLPGIEEQLDSLQVTLEHKVENCCKAIANAEAEEGFFKDELARLFRRAKSAAGVRLRLRNYVQGQLERLGIKKIEAGLFRVRIQRNSIPSTTFTGDPAKLPPEFQRIKIELNTDAAREAAKHTLPLPDGVRVEYGKQLRIT